MARDPGQCFTYPFEPGNRHTELLAYPGVGASAVDRGLTTAGGDRWQCDCTTDRQQFYQHFPTLAGHLLAANDVIQRHEHILARCRAILEWNGQGNVAAPDCDAGHVSWNECSRYSIVFDVSDQAIRIIELEGKAQDRRNGRERDVSLFPIELYSRDLLAFPFSFANYP